jgi:3'-5' exoribonuclease
MDKIFVKDLEIGQSVLTYFAVRKKELRDHEGKPYLVMELGDRTGRIEAVLWTEAQAAFKLFERGQVVKVKGLIGQYRERPQVTVEKIRVGRDGEFDGTWFLASSERDVEELKKIIHDTNDQITNPHLQKLLNAFFDDQEFLRRFSETPGAKLWHHPYLSGLLEHTISVLRLCQAAAALYPLAAEDLLLTSALIHDVGKTQEFEWGTYIDYTDQGRLLGHIVLGDRLIADKISQIDGFPVELGMRLRHAILSHHGSLEQGSPVVPQTLEALILYHADQMDAQSSALSRIIQSERAEGKKWSDWVNLAERFLYLGPEGKE